MRRLISCLLGIGLAITCAAPASTAAVQADTCAVKSRPSGKVLQGYWENWAF
jgi:chitinase